MSSNNIVKRIRSSKASGKSIAGSLSALPQVDDPTLQRWIKSISGIVDEGSKSYVRTKDLAKAGFIDKDGNIKIPDGSDSDNPEGSTIVPKAVANFMAKGGYSTITLTWETPQNKYFGSNEVYRSEVNDFGQAINIGSSMGDVYTDYIGNAAKAYYWVRTVSKFGIAGDISASASAETSINVDYLIDQLTGQISESTLSQALKGKVDLIAVNQENILKVKQDADKTKAETSQAINELITDINTEQKDRIAEAIQLQNGITAAQKTADNATESITTYKQSNDQALATVRQRVNVAVTDATTAINKTDVLDGRVSTAEQNTALALNKAEIAIGTSNTNATNLTALNAAIGTSVLSTNADINKQNLFAAYIVKKSSDLAANVIPNYAHLSTYSMLSRGYVEKYQLNGSSGNENTIGFYRFIVIVANATNLLIQKYRGGDAHAIYVDQKLFYSKSEYSGTGTDVTIPLSIGTHIIDFAFNNGSSAWGINYDNIISTQVSAMYAAEIIEIKKADSSYVDQVKVTADNANNTANANTTKIEGLNSRVGNNEASINDVKQTKAGKDEVVSISQQGLQSLWQADAQNKVDAMQIGGRNYFLDSKSSGNKAISSTFDFRQLAGKRITLSFVLQIKNQISTIASRNRIGFELSFAIQGGTQYVGVWASTVTAYPVGTHVVTARMSIGNTTQNPKDIWYYNQSGGVDGTDFVVSNIKLEIGDKNTDWTPAPEDGEKALTSFQALVTNTYSTKTETNTAIASGIQQYDASVSTSLPTEPDATKSNQWLWTELTTANRSDWSQFTVPDYSWLRKAATVSRNYLADGDTLKSYWWVNTIIFFRTIVSVSAAKTINLGNFTGDDAHAIYVNQKKVFEWNSYATNQVSFSLAGGVSVIDVVVSNGTGGAGFTAQNLLSGQVDWMRAPKSIEVQSNANASAITQTQAEVSNLNGQVSSLVSQTTTLTSTVNNIKDTGQANAVAITIDLSSREVGKAYPVGFILWNPRQRLRVWSALDALSVPSWATHRYGFMLDYSWSVGAIGWGVRGANREIEQSDWGWTTGNAPPLIKFDQSGESSIEIVWLRGGAKYHASIPDNATVVMPDGDGKITEPQGSKTQYWWHYYNEYTPPTAVYKVTANNTVTITQQAQVIDGIKALAMLQINNNGVVSGVGVASEMINGQVKSEIGFMANRFFFESPQGNVYPMVIDGNQTVINKAVIKDGSIDNAKIGWLGADKITTGDISADRMRANIVQAAQGRFDSLSVLSANMGRFESYKAGVGRGVIEGPNIWLYDTAGVNRIFIGLGD
ncbi:phage tail tip fiber protein [Acinetobacter ursingii]|uniref:phage tail tip fiber protein n=1 Tax=Acinetobacter ursingii TaxID=108980 RepID=UPI00124FF50F|nr:DUF1983 domain-containing protein [Acinetobacter ursingii]